MKPTLRLGAAVLAFAFVALHIPFLPASLEDLDSINFALGIRNFDVAQHQPHPPGYPVFMLAAKIVNTVMPSEALTLGLLAVLGGMAAAFTFVVLFEALDGPRPLVAALLAVSSPLFWVTSARPLSDVFGLAASLATQVLIIRARDTRALVVASVCAALAAGIRVQAVWLTVPLLALALGRHLITRQWKLAPGWVRSTAAVGAAYLGGLLVWAVPLIILTGGPGAYTQALFNQGAEDLTGVVMLWTTPTVRQLVRVLQAAFLAPWAFIWGAAIVLVFAAAGLVNIVRNARPALVTLLAAFGPYLVFDLLFQESATTRYALPLVVPVAFAAAHGAASVRSRLPAVALAGLAAANILVGTFALAGYSSFEAPAFRLLSDMASVASSRASSPAPVLAMHRRDELDMRRPIVWVGDRLPTFSSRIFTRPKHEWLELAKYWNDGGRAPIWFVADPPRSDLALVRLQRPPAKYRWPFSLPSVMGGVRPNEMDWYVIDPPDWYLGEGWAVTPETAGVAGEDGRGPSRGGSRGWIRRWPVQTVLVVGGRNLGSSPARVRVAIDGRTIDDQSITPGFFLKLLTLPAGRLSGDGDYASLTIEAEPEDANVAIEQFDLQPANRLTFGYGEGWNEHEYNPATGELWRWTTERATIRVHAGGRAVRLRIEGEIEEARTSHVTIRARDRVVSAHDIGETFSISTIVPADLVAGEEGAITIETSDWYVPAERRWRSNDRRHLGLKVLSCLLVPAS